MNQRSAASSHAVESRQRISISLWHRPGFRLLARIIALLKEKRGFLAINDKTPPETVYDLFGVSKKKFKAALGGLYKKRLIRIDEDGIRLV